MYHHIAPVPDNADPVWKRYCVRPSQFVDQLRWLQDHGYQTITPDELAAHFDQGTPLPDRPIMLTFDDGWAEQFSAAFPALVRAKFQGVFYVTTWSINVSGYISWDQLATMRDADGAGLAAPQVMNAVRICAIEVRGSNPRYPYKPPIPLTVLVNPVLTPLSAAAARAIALRISSSRTEDDTAVSFLSRRRSARTRTVSATIPASSSGCAVAAPVWFAFGPGLTLANFNQAGRQGMGQPGRAPATSSGACTNTRGPSLVRMAPRGRRCHHRRTANSKSLRPILKP
jgi:hypothetical protein